MMNDGEELIPVTFYSANAEEGSTRWHGFHAGANMSGYDVWVDPTTYLAVMTDDIMNGHSRLTDWAAALGMADVEGYTVTLAGTDEVLYRLSDCCFLYEDDPLAMAAMVLEHEAAYGDEHNEACPLCGVDAQK